MISVSEKNIHCLVHPGFDSGEHPEFEKNICKYIDYVAQKTNDILFIVTDGEIFDDEQMKQFTLLQTIEGIIYYLTGLRGFPIYIDGKYNARLLELDLPEELYIWCQKNINTQELDIVENKWKLLKNAYFEGKFKETPEEHDKLATGLRKEEIQARSRLDIADLAMKALEEIYTPFDGEIVKRNIKNEGRFSRIYQYAVNTLGKERMRELFIADGEKPTTLPINPVSHYLDESGNLVPSVITEHHPDFQGQVFNQSDSLTYGTAAKLRDDITTKLSLTRHTKLLKSQVGDILNDMGVIVTPDTCLISLGEYRDRCVNNVLKVIGYRLNIEESRLYLANDDFTLERPADYTSEEWFY